MPNWAATSGVRNQRSLVASGDFIVIDISIDTLPIKKPFTPLVQIPIRPTKMFLQQADEASKNISLMIR
jgi:hypothetical protein